MPVLVDSEQVLHKTTSPVHDICNPTLPLAAMVPITLQSTMKNTLWKSVMPDHMAKLVQIMQFDCCKQSICALYKVSFIYFCVQDPVQPP